MPKVKNDVTPISSFETVEETASGNFTPLPETNAEKVPETVSESRIWVYLGPSIRGIITNGSIHKGTRPEILKKFEGGIEKYPKIERLIVADRNVAEAKERLNEKKGSIYINYVELVRQISEKDKEV